MQIETKIAEMKYFKAVRNRDYEEIWNDEDPMFGAFKPQFHKGE